MVIICPKCGFENNDSKFCIKCGTKLEKEINTKTDDLDITSYFKTTEEIFEKFLRVWDNFKETLLEIDSNNDKKDEYEEDLDYYKRKLEKLSHELNIKVPHDCKEPHEHLKNIFKTLVLVIDEVKLYLSDNDRIHIEELITNISEFDDNFETVKNEIQNSLTITKNQKIKSWIECCPVCKSSELKEHSHKTLMGLSNEYVLECENCGSIFSKKGDKYQLKKTNNISSPVWLDYLKQTLTEREWTVISQGGMSDLRRKETDIDEWLSDAIEGKITFSEINSPIILKKNEKALLLLSDIELWEPRSVRQTVGAYGGPSFRVSNNVSFRFGGLSARSESHEELREIDRGLLTLTNKRLIFTGSKRSTNIDLRKIISIEAYKDGIESQRENKQKTEYFIGTDRSSLNITANGRPYEINISGTVLKCLIEGLIKNL